MTTPALGIIPITSFRAAYRLPRIRLPAPICANRASGTRVSVFRANHGGHAISSSHDPMRTLLRCLSSSATTTVATITPDSCCTRLIASSSYRALAGHQYPRRPFVSTAAAPSAMASPSSSPSTTATAATAAFSPGADETALNKALEPLLVTARQGGRWALIPGGEGLERSFKFKTFAKTWDFMTAVSLQCKLKNHHPEWSNVYNTTYIRWTTHSPKGLSAKDAELAAICDGLARDFGEIAEDQEAPPSCDLKRAADRAVAGAGAECCAPPRK